MHTIKKLILGAAVAFCGLFAVYADESEPLEPHYTVHYDANGAVGTVPSDDTVKLSDNSLCLPTRPSDMKLGTSTFLGWSTKQTGLAQYEGGKWADNLSTVADVTVTLYAVWSVQIDPTALPVAEGGVDYSGQLKATVSAGAVTWSFVPGAAFGTPSSSPYETFDDTVGTLQTNWVGDNGTWEFELPFDFPYFGKNYRKVYVNPNGSFAFNDTPINGNLSEARFGQIPIVAVYLADLGGNTADDCKIYTHVQEASESQAASVTIRWDVSNKDGGTGRIACSATLTPDGKIRLAYGEGNTKTDGAWVGFSKGNGYNNYYYKTIPAKQADVTDCVLDPSAFQPLPPGLNLLEDGRITGSPALGGVYPFCVKAEDESGRGRQFATFTITNRTTYTVTFDKNADDATGTMEDQTFHYTDAPQPLTACGYSRAGDWQFIGWSKTWNGEVAYADGAAVADLERGQGNSVCLYAIWSRGSYTLKFDANGGERTAEMADRRVDVGSTEYLPSPTRLGYNLAGWARTPDATEAEYRMGTGYDFGGTRDATVTLYAVWSPTTQRCTVTVGGNDWEFDIFGETAKLTEMTVTNGATSVTVPATVLGRPITELGGQLLWDNETVEELIFADGFNATGSEAFRRMRALKRVVLPDSVTAVGDRAFYDCSSLQEVRFGSGLKTIGSEAFSGCDQLQDVSLPASVETIGEDAFYSVRKVAFAGDVKEVGHSAFRYVRRLRFAGAVPQWSIADAADSSLVQIQHGGDASWAGFAAPNQKVKVYALGTPVTAADGNSWYVRDDGETVALVDPAEASGAVTLPSEVNGKPVTEIGDSFLAGNLAVTAVTIPALATNLMDHAFSYSFALTEIYLTWPNLVTPNRYAFGNATPLEHVYYLPQGASVWAGQTVFGKTVEPWPAAKCWTAKFDAGASDATDTMDDVLLAAGFEGPLPPNAFRRAKRKFVRWETDESPAATYDECATPASHAAGAVVTFKAIWRDAAVYTVAFDMNGGKASAQPNPVDLEVGAESDVATLPALADSDRENVWKFRGWSTEKTGPVQYQAGETYRNAEAAEGATVRLYAIWEAAEESRSNPRFEPGEDAYDANGCQFCYRYFGDGVVVSGVNLRDANVTTLAFPETLGGRPLTKIDCALAGISGRGSVRTVEFPASVENLRNSVCMGLAIESVIFKEPSKLAVIPSRAFYACKKLAHVTLPDSLETIDTAAFQSCSALSAVTLPKGLRGLEARAFGDCPFARLGIPATLEYAGTDSLKGAKTLRFDGDFPTLDVYSANKGTATVIEYPAANATWAGKTLNGYPDATYRAFVGPVAAMGAATCYFYAGEGETVTFAYAEEALGAEVTVPATVEGNGATWTVTGFEKNAFAGQPTTTVRYPQSWTERMYGVAAADLADGLVAARPAGAYCTVKFVGGGDATGVMGDFYVPTGYAANLPANAFRRPKYRFVKWQNLSASTDYSDKAAFTGAADGTTVTLDAVWEFVGDYTLRFEGNSAAATGVPEAIEMPVGTAYTIPADPVREGWQFDGWTNVVNATVYTAGETFSEDVAANQVFTLFAAWSETTETGLTYTDGNGTEWTYDRTGDVIRITDANPGADVDALDVPPPFKGATDINLADGTILPERQNGLWWKYRVTSNSAEITGYAGTVPANLVIPSTLGGYAVVGVASASQGLFEGVETLKSVEFPGSMTHVSRYLFNSCSNLETVVFQEGQKENEGLVEINGSFRDCPKLKEITFPDTFWGFPWGEGSFSRSGRADRGYDKYGLRYVDTAHTIVCETDPNWKGTLVIPDGVRFVASLWEVFGAVENVRDCVLPEGFVLRGSLFSRSPIQTVSIHETAERVSSSATAGSDNEITTVTVRGGAPSWNLKEYFTELTTVAYYRNQAAKWADYKAAHPDVTYVELDVKGQVGTYLSLDLVDDLGIEIDADYAAGDKVAVKVEGLAKGLRLVTTQLRETTGRKAVTNVVYTLQGVPAETVDLDSQPMFARVTVTKADRTKAETLQPIPLAIDWVTAEVNPAAVLGADYALAVTDIWPEADATWSFRGWPAGLKYTAKDILARDRSVQTPALTVYGKPMQAGVFTITATHRRPVGKATVIETETATLTVWGAADEKSFRYAGQVGKAIEPIAVGSDYKGFAGLPVGIRYTAKAIAANLRTGVAAVSANTLYGTPTKAGVFAVTATKADSANPKKTVKETFLWSVAEGENAGILDTFGWAAVNSTVTIREGAGLPDLPSSVAGAAKVTATGLPAGVRLVFDRATGKWTLTGMAMKAGNYVVIFRTTLNGVTTVERIAFAVEPNPYAGTWHGFQDPNPSATVARLADVTVVANGMVRLVLTEATTNANARGVIQSAVVKTTATVKCLDAGGTTATLTLPRNRKDPASADRTCVLDFEDGTLKVGETTLTLLKRKAADLPEVAMAVLEEVAGGETNAYAYLTATYNARIGSCAVAGSLWDGTAVRGTAYALDAGEGAVLSTVHVTDKAKNAVMVTLVWTDEGELLALVSENGRHVSIGKPGYDPLWTSCEASELRGQKFNRLLPECRTLTLVTDVGELALDIPEKMRAAAVSAQGLVRFTLSDADGYRWVCELVPVEVDGDFQFRGIATGTKRGEPTEVFPVYAR